MPVKRIASQFDLTNSDTVILVYGQVNDIFITEDLRMHDSDGIEKILALYLHEHGYDQIIFYSPERQLYAYDETSYTLCFPPENTPAAEEEQPVAAVNASTKDNRPLGTQKFLRIRQTAGVNGAGNDDRKQPLWNKQEGYISVIRGGSDAAVADIIRASMRRTDGRTAVILSQFDNPRSNSEVLRLLEPLISGFRRRHIDNKIFIITNAIDLEKLKELVDGMPALSSIVAMRDAAKGLDSLLHMGYPQQDEIRSIIHRQRILKAKEVDWLQLNRIVRALDFDRNTLKRWETMLRKMAIVNVTELNKQKVLTSSLSMEEKPPLKKLDALVGLNNVKQALRRYIRQLQEIRQHNPDDKPLMHIMLKGNPGTGKTTLARLIAAILYESGLLERGQLIEVDQARLIAGYVGQTAIATDNCCREALDGALFIDEAYGLMPRKEANNTAGASSSFGQEAIDTLIKRMSDWQDRFCVILAGYPAEMDNLLEANPGFKGRIGLTLTIEDYKPEELLQIFNGRVKKSKLTTTEEFDQTLEKVFTSIYRTREKKFDNGRTVEQLFARINELRVDRCDRLLLDPRQTSFEVEDIPAGHLKNAQKHTPEGNAMEKLKEMIGLQKAKRQIQRQLAAVVTSSFLEPELSEGRRLHLVFRGNPGTGKTTVARLVGKIYQHHQVLSNNVFVEASRGDLVGQVQGETALKVAAKIEEAMGGILFIDEAYSLVNGDNDTFGKEAIDTLLKKMDDHRNDLCVIIAGYPDPLRDFLKSNPGLSRRFPTTIDFDDYNAEQLYQIFQFTFSKYKLTLEEGLDEKIKQIMQHMYDRKDKQFGNAGNIENFIQHMIEGHSVRCLEQQLIYRDTPIILADLPEEAVNLLPVDNDNETIDQAMKELNELVGLAPVKKYVKDLVEAYRHQQRRAAAHPGLAATSQNYNMLFTGNPGTGKTTVAKLMGKIFRALDILKRGEVLSATRDSFIARYQGHTTSKTQELVRNSLDNILFIDEAYSLFLDGSDTVGREAIDALIPMMTEHRDRLVVIAAGYPRELQHLMRANSGLSSRFPQENRISFPDYNGKEMVQIFKNLLKKWRYELQDGLEKELEDHLNYYKVHRGHEFGNARDVETWLNNVVLPKHRERVAKLETDDKWFSTIIREDLPPVEGSEQTATGDAHNKTADDFSPAREKKEQGQNTSAINNYGSGDVFIGTGGKTIINHYHDTNENGQLLTDLPHSEGPLFGRDEVIKELYTQLTDPKSNGKLVMYGIGGIGKTKTALHLVTSYQYSFSHIIWLEAKTNLQKSFIENGMLIQRLGVNLGEADDDATRYAQIITKINSLRKEVLLVIDGLSASSAKELESLTFTNTRILITSRQQMPGIRPIKLDPPDKSAAIQLFNSFYQEEISDDVIDQLLQPVSYHPLAVEILAKMLQTNPNMTFDRLLDHIHGLEITRGEIDITYKEGGESNDEVIEIFKSLFNIAGLSEEEIDYLLYFSVLPDRPVPRRLIYDLFLLDDDSKKDHFNNIVVMLQRKGFLSVDSSQGLFCHQIIQQVCRSQYPPTLQNCEVLFISLGTNLCNKIEYSVFGKAIFNLITDYLYILETFVTHFNETNLSDYPVYINLSQLYRANGQFTQSLAVSTKEKANLESVKDDFSLWYSLINFNIGITRTMMGDYADAEKAFEETARFIEKIDLEERTDRIQLENMLISSWSQLGGLQMRVGKNDLDNAIICFEKALDIENNCEQPAPLALVSLKQGLALAQIELNKYKDAIVNLKQAQSLLIDEEGMERDSLLINLIDVNIAVAYANDNDLSNARFYSNRAIENIVNHLPEDDIQCYEAFYIGGVIDLQDGLTKLDETEEVDLDLFIQAANRFARSIKIVEHHRKEDHEDFFLIYSNYALALKYSNREDEGFRIQKKSLDICRKQPVKNVLMMSIFFRTIYYFGTHPEVTTDTEKHIYDCLDILPDKPDHYIDIAYINHILGEYRVRDNRAREAITAHSKALEYVQKAFVKDKDNPDNDSPLEVLCMQAIAGCHSSLHEHFQAIKWQKQAIQLCEKHMELDDKELADPYIGLARIYLAAAIDEQVSSDSMEYYALSLEYKTKAETLDDKLLQDNSQLDESGRLYQVLTKNEKGEARKELMIIPYRYYTEFETAYAANTLAEPGKYGYVLPEPKGLRRDEIIEHYVEKYGPLTDKAVKLN